MSNILTLILGLVVMLLVVGGGAYLLQRNVQKNGNLFTGPPTSGMKIFAFLLGLLFTAYFLMEFFYTPEVHIIPPILAFALFAYTFGAEKIIKAIQNLDKK